MNYDKNTGRKPRLNDYVEIVNSTPEDNGLRGTIHGWCDYDGHVALITLDKPREAGCTVISYPVVCLKEIFTGIPEQKNIFHDVFETKTDNQSEVLADGVHPTLPAVFVKPRKLEGDAFITWSGGAPCPVDPETIIQVKPRNGKFRQPVAAKFWPKITWMHRPIGDPMSGWDVVAYRVVK